MPTPTYTPLASITLASTATEIVFTGIPQTGYRDLVLVLTGSKSAWSYNTLQFNGDAGNNYASVWAKTTGTSPAVTGGTATEASGLSSSAWTGPTLAHITLQIMDYQATDRHKHYLMRSGHTESASGYDPIAMLAGRWASNAAITSIRFAPNSGTLSAGFTAHLYGIAG